ncbi:MAG: gyrase subunit [Clostridia bacterium]|jgi:DNA gyrase subunit A|nr:gyrase, subunit [Clostridiales bacterium]MDK2984363.1 gyrase subunit [Clostridia bacterium]
MGKVLPISIEEEMQKSYIDYAMSVIVGRALPDVRDGLKPVHRRILYAMHEAGLTPDKPHKKSATVVGTVMAKYHPHGDAAIYDTMVRMAQDFSYRYPLVDGHGNFGSIDGDAAAAMRYTEARMSKIATELLRDIEKDTVDFTPNYDETLKEPTVLPSKVPNLLINGSSGIAVGMATNIPPHNLGETIDAIIALIENPEISIEKLMKNIKAPDFPTGGIIMGKKGVIKAYNTGRGTIKVRAKAQIETLNNGKSRIIVTELPYQVNKAKLVEKIADLVRDKKIDGISDLRDESDRKGMRIVIEVKKDTNPRILLNKLYKHTQLEENFGIIMLALVDGYPKVLNLKQILVHYLEHQKDVIVRRTRYDLARAEEKAHILEGLRIALDNLDEVINIIRSSKTVPEARERLIDRFSLSEKQAQAILDMRLHRLTGLEREKIEADYKEVMEKIAYFKKVLADENEVLKIITEELTEIKEKYSDNRRTQVSQNEEVIDIEDLIEEEEVVITITHRGYIKRLPVDTYRSQKRGGRGIVALTTREQDVVENLFVTTTHHFLLFFTNKGKVYRLKVHEIPEASRQARGTAIVNLLYLENGEYIKTVIPVKEFTEGYYLLMATRQGIVKKTELIQYDTSRRDGIIALSLDGNDELIGVQMTSGNDEVIIGTSQGKVIRFHEEEVRTMGRTARGVKGITLDENDDAVSLELILPNAYVVAITEKGFGKKTPVEDYRSQSRGGKGIITFRQTPRNGRLIALRVAYPKDEVMMITSKGIIIRLDVDDISSQGRVTQGVTLMKLDEEDTVTAAAIISHEDED